MNKKNFFLIFLCIIAAQVKSQNSLVFEQVKTISDSEETVPAGMVWKITGIYGSEVRVNECIDATDGSTHEIGERMRCANYPTSERSYRFTYIIQGFQVDGMPVVLTISGLRDASYTYFWNSPDCSGSSNHSSSTVFVASCANKDADPTIFPIWLP